MNKQKTYITQKTTRLFNIINRGNTSVDYALTIVSNYGLMGLGFISSILLARLPGPEGRGEFAIYTFLPTLVSSLVPAISGWTFGRLIGRHKRLKTKLIPVCFQLMTILNCLVILLVYMNISLLVSSSSTLHYEHIAVALIISVLSNYISPLSTFLRNNNKIHTVNIVLLFTSIMLILVYVTCWLFSYTSAFGVFCLNQAVYVVCFLVMCFSLKTNLFKVREKHIYAACIKAMVPFIMPTITSSIYFATGNFLLIRLTNLSELGYFVIANAVCIALTAFITAFSMLGYVDCAKEKKIENANKLIASRVKSVQLLLILLLIIALPTISPVIEFFYGQQYSRASELVLLLLPAVCLQGMNTLIYNMLLAQKISRIGIYGKLCAVIITAYLSLLLCPELGAKGYCIAFFTAVLFSFIGTCIYLKIKFHSSIFDYIGITLGNLKSTSNYIYKNIAQIKKYLGNTKEKHEHINDPKTDSRSTDENTHFYA
jgi:O-antigen/teichoic acid export membrane protein